MSLKIAYIALIVIFFLSIPVALKRDAIGVYFSGYSTKLALKKYDAINDKKMISEYYYAYKNSFKTIHKITMVVITIWCVTLIVSIILLWLKLFLIPYKWILAITIISFLLTLFFLVLPTLLFKNGVGPVT